MSVQLNISAGYLSSFENPIGVSVIAKLNKWPTLQRLGFAASLPHLNQNFHGLKDFNDQMRDYSSTSSILMAAWSVIKQLAPKNLKVVSLMFNSPVLGQVGLEFQHLSGFGQAFAVSPDQLKQPSAITRQVQTGFSQISTNIAATVDVSGGPSLA